MTTRGIDSIMSRRRFLQGTGALALAATSPLLENSAVHAEPGVTNGARQRLTMQEEETPVQGGNLYFISRQVPSSLDANVWTATAAAVIMRQLYDPLVWQPEGGQFVPGLAESWEISADGLSYTFTLRQDVTFHDGTPLNAESVKATYDRMIDPATKSLQIARLGPYDRSEVVSEFVVRIYLTEPFAPLLSSMSEVALAPISPAAVEALGDGFARTPVSTGPFKVKEWPDETTLIFERNPDYAWAPEFFTNPGPAHLDTITYRFIEEESTRMVSLETGEADIVEQLPAMEIQTVQENEKFQLSSSVLPGMPELCSINVSNGPTQELAVRQAMLFGVDREALALVLFQGGFPAAHGPLTSASWAYWEGVEDMYPFDPDKAADLLDKAGWVMGGDGVREKEGQKLTVRAVTSAGGETQRVAEFVQASLMELGFDYVVEAMAYEATATRFAENDYEVGRFGLVSIDPHDSLFAAFHSSQIEGGSQFNRSRIDDSEMDELIERAAVEGDTEKRGEIYRELQQRIMEQALILPAFERPTAYGLQPRVHGFADDLLGRPYLSNTWLGDD